LLLKYTGNTLQMGELGLGKSFDRYLSRNFHGLEKDNNKCNKAATYQPQDLNLASHVPLLLVDPCRLL
jgi:hypothetical protein